LFLEFEKCLEPILGFILKLDSSVCDSNIHDIYRENVENLRTVTQVLILEPSVFKIVAHFVSYKR
jgi:hypothetical protein